MNQNLWWNLFLKFSWSVIIGCAQPHSLAPTLVKLNLLIVNIAGTSLTCWNSSGTRKYLGSGFGISFSKKSRFHKVFIYLSPIEVNGYRSRAVIHGINELENVSRSFRQKTIILRGFWWPTILVDFTWTMGMTSPWHPHGWPDRWLVDNLVRVQMKEWIFLHDSDQIINQSATRLSMVQVLIDQSYRYIKTHAK